MMEDFRRLCSYVLKDQNTLALLRAVCGIEHHFQLQWKTFKDSLIIQLLNVSLKLPGSNIEIASSLHLQAPCAGECRECPSTDKHPGFSISPKLRNSHGHIKEPQYKIFWSMRELVLQLKIFLFFPPIILIH